MPIYEYYCSANHKIYQFYAKTLAQGRIVPRCPDNPRFTLEKIVSRFAFTGLAKSDAAENAGQGSDNGRGANDPAEDAKMDALEREFTGVDENDPRAMGRMFRRMTEVTGEKIPEDMEEVVRKLEEGADPEKLDEQLGGGGEEGGGEDDPYGGGMGGMGGPQPPQDPKEPRQRLKARRGPPARDPKLYDYE